MDWLVQDFKSSYGIDLSEDKMALQWLWENAEKAKIELSEFSTESEIEVPHIPRSARCLLRLDAKLTRAEFQRMTSHAPRPVQGPRSSR